MLNSKNIFVFDQTIASMVKKDNQFSIDLFVYISVFFKNLRNEVDIYSEKFENLNKKKLNFTDCKLFERGKFYKFINDRENECLENGIKNTNLLQYKLDLFLQNAQEINILLKKQLFQTSQEYIEKITYFKEFLSVLKKELFKENLFFVDWSYSDSLKDREFEENLLVSGVLVVIESPILDDIQINAIKLKN